MIQKLKSTKFNVVLS